MYFKDQANMEKLYISCNYSALEGPFNVDIDFSNWAAVFFYHSHISPKIQTPYSAIVY